MARGRRRTVLGVYALNTAIKLARRAAAPELPGLPPLTGTPTGLSFPSAHASTSFAGALAYSRLGLPAAPLYALAAGLAPLAPVPRRALPVRRAGGSAARHGAGRGAATAKRGCGRPLVSTRIGIVGMPNAGKSSLFNALTKAGAEAANYPFTTIEPNVAVVPVRDERLEQVAATVGASEIVWDTIDFHDIAGLVAGAHEGEGLGNRFLANIRETDAIVHVVRAHGDENVIHPEGRVDPLADIETIETELVLADLEQAERRVERVAKQAAGGDRVGDRRGGVAARGDRGAAGRAPGARRAGARGGAERGPRPRLADEQAGAVRGERRRGLRGGARRRSPSTPPPRARARSRSPRASSPSWRSSTTRKRPRCAPSSAVERVGPRSGSCARPSRCSS